MNQMSKKGFTLIELLIVVAIIAILAAIAVPNFLEAQIRSKVSRAKADQRSLATALEAYAVDNNNYPPIRAPNTQTGVNGPSVFLPGLAGVSSRFIRLTTPIAYITSVFRDPFIPANLDYAKTVTSDAVNATVRSSGPAPGGTGDGYDTYDYVDARSFLPGGVLGNRTDGAARCSGARWHIVSAGPDLINAFGGGTTLVATRRNWGMDYDPTNGTISNGDIVRIGGGPGDILDNSLPVFDRVTGRFN
jgi:prepilin-type N-terminal cleavage/methylation domain-containing protein